jgi:hypothetical protein
MYVYKIEGNFFLVGTHLSVKNEGVQDGLDVLLSKGDLADAEVSYELQNLPKKVKCR